MSKRMLARIMLRQVRSELTRITTSDAEVTEAIKRCVGMCDLVLSADDKAPYQKHSETSYGAAQFAKINERMDSVLILLDRYEGLTDEEGQSLLSLDGNSYRPCRVKLVDAGFVEDSEKRRITSHSRRAVVWSVTDKGREHLRSGRHD